MNRFRGRRIWRVLLALGSLFFVLSSLRAQADSCGAGVECEELEAAPLDRGFVTQLVGEPKGRPLQGEELLARTHELGFLLRCPTCQGSSVSDSPSSTALNMRQEVMDLLAEGYSEEQILDYFEAAYGQFVLLQPKAEGFTLLVWLAPGALLLLGAGFLVAYFRRGGRSEVGGAEAGEAAAAAAGAQGPGSTDAATPRPREREEIPEELRPWLAKVRALAYGHAEATEPAPAGGPSEGGDR